MKKNLYKLSIVSVLKKIFLISILLISGSTFGQVDRSIPDAGPAPEIKFKTPITKKLSNNLTLMVVEDNKLPTASATLIIDNPPILSKGKSGV